MVVVAERDGWVVRRLGWSPITGPEGNIEFWVWLSRTGEPEHDDARSGRGRRACRHWEGSVRVLLVPNPANPRSVDATRAVSRAPRLAELRAGTRRRRRGPVRPSARRCRAGPRGRARTGHRAWRRWHHPEGRAHPRRVRDAGTRREPRSARLPCWRRRRPAPSGSGRCTRGRGPDRTTPDHRGLCRRRWASGRHVPGPERDLRRQECTVPRRRARACGEWGAPVPLRMRRSRGGHAHGLDRVRALGGWTPGLARRARLGLRAGGPAYARGPTDGLRTVGRIVSISLPEPGAG